MIRILTDSASDILPAEAEQLGVTVIPLNVTLEDGTVLRDGVDMTPHRVLRRDGPLPQAAHHQPAPALSCSSASSLRRLPPGDEVVGIFLSHELSGTCQCARLAADMANVDNVLFVDSENVCLARACWCGWLFSCGMPERLPGRSPPPLSTPRSICIWWLSSTT